MNFWIVSGGFCSIRLWTKVSSSMSDGFSWHSGCSRLSTILFSSPFVYGLILFLLSFF